MHQQQIGTVTGRTRASTGLLVFGILAAMSGISWGLPRAAAWKILDINAKSYDQAEGGFTDSPGSSANSPLKWVLVTVVVRGEVTPDSTMHTISLSGVERGKTVFKKTITPSFFRQNNGKFSVPFWIEGDRCETLKLTAVVSGTNGSVMKKTVGYSCGE